MRIPCLFLALTFAAPAAAQNWYIPDNSATTGNCNVIPFGSTGPGSFYNSKFQTRCTAAELGALPNLITGLGFASCGTGRSHFDQIEVVLDHIPPAQPLTTTFASNLTPAAVTVLNATNYTWNLAGNAWNEIGLQNFFVYNGVDDLVVQITMTSGTAPGGFHRGTRQRIYWIGATGPAPATGSTDSAASKVEVSMLMARTSSHGDGCLGTNGTPALGFTGSPQVGSTISFNLTNGVSSGIGVLLAGTTNGFPFPFDLGSLGAPNCYAYTDLAASAVVLLDPAGAGGVALPIPQGLGGFRFYGQYAVLDLAANPFGLTTSNYLHVHTGN